MCLSYVSERTVRCVTRSLKNAVMQQQMISVDKALQILDHETPPLVVDREKLKVCVIKYLLVTGFLHLDAGWRLGWQLTMCVIFLLSLFLATSGAVREGGDED